VYTVTRGESDTFGVVHDHAFLKTLNLNSCLILEFYFTRNLSMGLSHVNSYLQRHYQPEMASVILAV